METTLLCCKIERNERMNIIHGLLHPQKKKKRVETTPYMPQLSNSKLAAYQIFYFCSDCKSSKVVVKVLCMFQEKSGPGLKTSHLVRVTLSAVKYLHCRSRSWRQQPQPCWQRKLTQRKSLTKVSIICTAKYQQRKHFEIWKLLYLMLAELTFVRL